MNIIVLGLPRITNNEELTELFKTHGIVESCEIVMDKETEKSKGFGFIEMKNDDEANAAITALHGSKIGNNRIRVKASNKAKS